MSNRSPGDCTGFDESRIIAAASPPLICGPVERVIKP